MLNILQIALNNSVQLLKLKHIVSTSLFTRATSQSNSNTLFQENMDQLIINPSVRLIPHRQVDPGFFVYDALVMGKGLEAFLTVIASHTAFPETAEWHFAGGEVNDHIVDTATAEATLRGDFFADGFFLGKNVKSQRMSHGIYLSDYFFYGIKSKDRHYRSEDFCLHYGIFEGYLIHDCRFNL